MKKLARCLCIVLALFLLGPMATDQYSLIQGLRAYAEETQAASEQTVPGANEVQQEQELEDFQEPEYTPQFTMPEELRAVDLTPGANFAASENATSQQISTELDGILNNLLAMGMNSVIVDTSYKGTSYFTTDINETVEKTAVELAVEAAKKKGFFVYLTFDMNFVLGQFDPNAPLQTRIDYLALAAHQFTVKYHVDGVILDGYYSAKNTAAFEDYMSNGSGIGFDNWLLDNGAYVFSLVSDAIRKTNNTVPVGIYIRNVWANAAANPDGSKTKDDFQALTDGYADTLGYVRKGFADFILVEAEGSLDDASMPFHEIVSWWADAAKRADIPLFVLHQNDKICTNATGWISPDQIVKQLIHAKSISGYKGSAFRSYSALSANPGSSTSALIKYYDNTLNMETIDNELTINSPPQRVFTTEEPSVAFQGSFDPNFEVYFNGEIIELSEAGTFYYEEPLEIGLNTFTIKNKATTITYSITRKINVLKSIDPTAGEMTVEEKTNIIISAIAYKGSTVSAKIGGKNVEMKATEGSINGEENSSYVKYTGLYVAPKGIVGKTQDLGNIVVYGRYVGKNGASFEASITGAHVVVNALPEIPNNADGNIIRVKNDNTLSYDYSTTDKIPTPNQPRLPAGTLDYITKKVTYSGIDYYLTLSGKRLKASDVTVLANEPLGSNTLSAVSAVKDGTDTVVTIQPSVKTPFSVSFGGVNYSAGNYSISSFSASNVTITFDYANSSSGGFSFPSGALFSSASWGSPTDSGNVSRISLTLTLSRNGIFAGMTASYEGDSLVFRFNGYRNSLSGATVVIDPGHGMTASGSIDPGGVGYVTDQQVGLGIAIQLESKLKAAGANVVRLKTESQYIDTYSRSEIARQYRPDIYIAIHGNKVVDSPGTRGVEAFYFTPFSQPLAASVSSSVANYYKNSVYGDGVNRNRGAKYDYYAVTLQQDFASILLEVGFVTNYEEAMAMASSTHQAGLADAIVQGFQNYLSR